MTNKLQVPAVDFRSWYFELLLALGGIDDDGVLHHAEALTLAQQARAALASEAEPSGEIEPLDPRQCEYVHNGEHRCSGPRLHNGDHLVRTPELLAVEQHEASPEPQAAGLPECARCKEPAVVLVNTDTVKGGACRACGLFYYPDGKPVRAEPPAADWDALDMLRRELAENQHTATYVAWLESVIAALDANRDRDWKLARAHGVTEAVDKYSEALSAEQRARGQAEGALAAERQRRESAEAELGDAQQSRQETSEALAECREKLSRAEDARDIAREQCRIAHCAHANACEERDTARAESASLTERLAEVETQREFQRKLALEWGAHVVGLQARIDKADEDLDAVARSAGNWPALERIRVALTTPQSESRETQLAARSSEGLRAAIERDLKEYRAISTTSIGTIEGVKATILVKAFEGLLAAHPAENPRPPAVDPWDIEPDDLGAPGGKVWRIVPRSARVARAEQGSGARPNYIATVYSLEHAELLAAYHNAAGDSPKAGHRSEGDTTLRAGKRITSAGDNHLTIDDTTLRVTEWLQLRRDVVGLRARAAKAADGLDEAFCMYSVMESYDGKYVGQEVGKALRLLRGAGDTSSAPEPQQKLLVTRRDSAGNETHTEYDICDVCGQAILGDEEETESQPDVVSTQVCHVKRYAPDAVPTAAALADAVCFELAGYEVNLSARSGVVERAAANAYHQAIAIVREKTAQLMGHTIVPVSRGAVPLVVTATNATEKAQDGGA